jgi:hypothetical protein
VDTSFERAGSILDVFPVLVLVVEGRVPRIGVTEKANI